MPYRKVVYMELEEVYRRWKAGQSIREIAAATGWDRKTVRKYIKFMVRENCSGPEGLTSQQLVGITKSTRRRAEMQAVFTEYAEEIRRLLASKRYPLKLKSVYEVICNKYELGNRSSLSSFRRYVISNGLRDERQKTTCRLDKQPGEEIQVDYAKMGQMIDPITGKKKTVYAFIGTLASSRHKFVEFVNRQDQVSFAESHAHMFTWFGGVTKVITLDNLKAGVIKPDLYDPLLNRTYADMAKHYECFINPARVARPKDKPTVERDVQTIREEYLKLIVLKPDICLLEANSHIKNWLINVYGTRNHGTTQDKPYEFFIEVEHPLLKSLPAEAFEAAVWKEAKVHPDCYIQVDKKAYSVPFIYVGKTLNVKVKSRTVEIYYEEELIKEHLIPKTNRQTDYSDFPENVQNVIDKGLPYFLQREAERISGENLRNLIVKLLTPHAFVNLRRAQGVVAVAGKFEKALVEEAALLAVHTDQGLHPKIFEHLLVSLRAQKQEAQESQDGNGLTCSPATESFVRPAIYFT